MNRTAAVVRGLRLSAVALAGEQAMPQTQAAAVARMNVFVSGDDGYHPALSTPADMIRWPADEPTTRGPWPATFRLPAARIWLPESQAVPQPRL